MKIDPAPLIPDTSLTSKQYEEMTLPELLETRDKLIEFEKDIKKLDGGHNLFKFAMGKLQAFIHYRRTHTPSGLIIPYDNTITSF